MTSNLARAENIIKQNITQLDTLSIDYAHWTETYTYVDQPSQAYIDSALNESTFKSQNLNIIVIVRNSGEMLYGKDYDPASGQFGDIPAGFQDLLIPGAKLVAFTSEDSKVDGIANLPKGLLMVVSRPVLTDDSQGPSRGVIIMGRWITPEMTKGFAELVNLPGLLITSSSSSSLPHEYDQVKGDLPAGPKLVAIDDHTVAGYAMMEDIQQQKSIVIRLEEPRTIYQSGVDSFRNYAILLVLACLLFEGGVVFLLQILVVSPIKHLTQVAGKVANGNVDINMRYLTAKDEIGVLSRTFQELVHYFKEAAGFAVGLANSDLTGMIAPRSPEDVLSKALDSVSTHLKQAVGQIASSTRILSETSGDVAGLANQVNQSTGEMTQQIHKIYTSTQEQTRLTQQAAASLGEIVASIHSISESVQGEAASIKQSSKSSQQISQQIEVVANNVQRVSEKVNQAASAAQSGSQTVESTIQSIGNFAVQTRHLAEKVNEAGGRSHDISAIIATIDDIAAQTNLLALNAAIEAARAGEHGKGFAVVADEVRKLAEKSTLATKEVATIIGNIQKAVGEAVTAAQQSEKDANISVELAGQARIALAQILAAIDESLKQAGNALDASRQVGGISSGLARSMEQLNSTAMENEQSTRSILSRSEDVNQAIEHIVGLSQENDLVIKLLNQSAAGMDAQVSEVKHSLEKMNQMAEVLNTMVAQFKL